MIKFATGREETGATMVELTIALPVLLAGIFFLSWLGALMHANSALESALSRALRLASTRGSLAELSGAEMISDIHKYTDSPSVITAHLDKLLSHDVGGLSAAETDYYNPMADHAFTYRTDGTALDLLSDLPPEYVYTMAYVAVAMKESIGGNIKYPCDPRSLTNGAGCLACAFLNPDTLEPNFPWSAPAAYSDAGGPPRRSMGIECAYQPDSMFLKPLAKFIGIFSSDVNVPLIMVSRRQFLDIPAL